MTVIWLLAWCCFGTPSTGLGMWGIALVACIAIDVLGILKKAGGSE